MLFQMLSLSQKSSLPFLPHASFAPIQISVYKLPPINTSPATKHCHSRLVKDYEQEATEFTIIGCTRTINRKCCHSAKFSPFPADGSPSWIPSMSTSPQRTAREVVACELVTSSAALFLAFEDVLGQARARVTHQADQLDHCGPRLPHLGGMRAIIGDSHFVDLR